MTKAMLTRLTNVMGNYDDGWMDRGVGDIEVGWLDNLTDDNWGEEEEIMRNLQAVVFVLTAWLAG